MMICGVDLLGTMTTPGVWVPEQVGNSQLSENSLDKLLHSSSHHDFTQAKYNFSCTLHKLSCGCL